MKKITEQQFFFINKINTILGKSINTNHLNEEKESKINEETEKINNENNDIKLSYKKEEERVLGGTDYKKFEEISKIIEKQTEEKKEESDKNQADKLKMGCSNDLRKERQLYEKSTKEKIYAARLFKDEGDFYLKKKEYDKAYISYEKGMTQLFYTFEEKEDENEVDKLKLMLNSNIAMCKIGQLLYKEAIGYLNEVLKIDKSHIKGIYRLAYIYFKIEDFDQSRLYINEGKRIIKERSIDSPEELSIFTKLEEDVFHKEKENNQKLEGLLKKMIIK